jgi:hypothetical protein
MQRIVLRFVVVIGLCILASGRAWATTYKVGPMAKVSHELVIVYDEQESYLAQGSGAAFKPSNPLMRIIDGRVVIDAVASDDVHALQAALEALGMQGAVAFGRIVSGWMPISAIEAMAALASLQFARAAYATTNVGLVTSQGDQAMRAAVARATFGVDGTGVTVGVLSDSFNCLGGAAAGVASDDLFLVTVIQESPNCSGVLTKAGPCSNSSTMWPPVRAWRSPRQKSVWPDLPATFWRCRWLGLVSSWTTSSTSPSRCSRTGSLPKLSIRSRG